MTPPVGARRAAAWRRGAGPSGARGTSGVLLSVLLRTLAWAFLGVVPGAAGAAPAAVAAAPVPAAGAGPRSGPLVALVLPSVEQDVERAFKDALRRKLPGVRFLEIQGGPRAEFVAQAWPRLRAARVALVYARGAPISLALAGRRELPLVFTQVADPVGSGLVAALDQPGGKVTGVVHVAPLALQWNAMNAYRPVRRVGYVVNPGDVNSRLNRAALGELAGRSGFAVVDVTMPLDAHGAPDLGAVPALLRRLAELRPDLLYLGPGTFQTLAQRDLVTRLALEAQLPTFCATEGAVRDGSCLFGLFAGSGSVGRLAAWKAGRILAEGVSPGALPVQSLQAFTLLINLPVAARLRLYPPLSLLSVAEVIPLPGSELGAPLPPAGAR